MRILLVRHGRAVDPYEAPSDEQRWLTPEGRAIVRRIADALVEAGVGYTHMFTSPLVRAVQTAELLASAPGFEGPLTVVPDLAPDFGSTARALAPIERLPVDATVAFVGHEPRIRVMAGQLLGVQSMPAFRTGSACMVSLEGTVGRFEWVMDPETRTRITQLDAWR